MKNFLDVPQTLGGYRTVWGPSIGYLSYVASNHWRSVNTHACVPPAVAASANKTTTYAGPLPLPTRPQ